MPEAAPFPADAPGDGAPLAAGVRAAGRRADARIAAGLNDLRAGEHGRLHERVRLAAGALIDAAVIELERDLIGRAAPSLQGHPGAAKLKPLRALPRLRAAGLLDDAGLMGEAILRAQQAAIEEALLAAHLPDGRAGLSTQMTESGDGAVRARALAYLLADDRRRHRPADLLHGRLVWWVAAAAADAAGGDVAIDRALARSAEAIVAARDAESVETAAADLAAAVALTPTGWERLLIDAVREARLTLFVALLARALSIDADEIRMLALDPDGDRLWLALRAAGLRREAVARIGWLLCEADGRRDVEALPDALDALDDVSADDAVEAFASLRLPAALRAAMRDLDRGDWG